MSETAPSTSPFAAPPAGPCAKKEGCVLDAGHKGFCRLRPLDAPPARSHGTKRTGARAPRKPPAGSSLSGAPSATSTRPSRAKKSEGMRPLLSFLWGGVGQLLEQYGPEPQGPPVGRLMQFQAPYAAEKLHPQLRKIPAYRALDEASAGVLDELGPVIMAPLLVAVMASNESARMALWPLLSAQLEVFAVAAAAEKRKAAAAMRSLDEHSEEVAAMMDGLAGVLFAPGPAAPAYEDDPEVWAARQGAAAAGAPAPH